MIIHFNFKELTQVKLLNLLKSMFLLVKTIQIKKNGVQLVVQKKKLMNIC